MTVFCNIVTASGHVSVSLVVMAQPLHQPWQRSGAERGTAGQLPPRLLEKLRCADSTAGKLALLLAAPLTENFHL